MLTSIISIITVHVAVKHADAWGVYDDYECSMHQPTRAQQSKGGRSVRGKATKMESFITAAAQSPFDYPCRKTRQHAGDLVTKSLLVRVLSGMQLRCKNHSFPLLSMLPLQHLIEL